MEPELYKALISWGEARKATKDNASLLVRLNFSENVRKQCTDQMKAFGEAEQRLFDFEGQKNLPRELVRFFEAYHDRGCTLCMLSSAPPTHAECSRLIEGYFRAVEDLEDYVYKSLM